MKVEIRNFYSDGIKLGGCFYLPDNNKFSKSPLIIACSGFTGLNSIHPARFARFFTQNSMICFGFDYRGFGESEGKKGWVLIEEQVRDIRNAFAYSKLDPRVDTENIFLLGWGMGAGLIIEAAKGINGLKALCAINGFYNGIRFLQAHRSKQQFELLVKHIEDERSRRAVSGKSQIVDPFKEIYLMDSVTTDYVDSELRNVPNYETMIYFEFAESLLCFNPESYAFRLKLPIFIAHGDNNNLHPVDEANSLYKIYTGTKELYWIKDAGHTEWMFDDNPKFKALATRILEWFQKI